MKRIITVSAVAGILILHAASSPASQVISGKVTDLTKANVAFTGVCVSAEPAAMALGERGKILVSKYTFTVEDSIKGDVPSSFAFTHLGGSRSAALSVGQPYIPGMPFFEAGKRYTVFLSSETPYGLRGVINMGVGKFNFITGADGKTQVVNDYGNKSLFKGLPSTAKVGKALSAGGVSAGADGGPLDYDSFVKMIKELDKKE
ncbi:MAG: hypothetical protein JXA24_07565 [Proteobacteria bacterium]|nr:hypothetical protein [Pseudomonadota bacterium]